MRLHGVSQRISRVGGDDEESISQVYSPFVRGIEQGRIKSECPTCGTSPGNQHTLTTGGMCDRMKSGKGFSEDKAEQMARLIKTRARVRKPREV